MNLWHLKTGSTPALPILERAGGGITAAGNDLTDLTTLAGYTQGKMQDPINVVDEFPWTVSPQSSRNDVPRLQLIEKRIKLNSTVTNLAYSALASVDSFDSAGSTISNGVIGALTNTSPDGDDTGPSIAGGIAKSIETAGNATKNFLEKYKSLGLDAGGLSTFQNPALKPYEGLYSLEDTGFAYYFPYLDDTFSKSSNSFSQSSDGIVAPIANKLAGFAEAVAGITNLVKPGTYIEKAKQFEMKDEGKTLSFKLPLLNTISVDDISRNWQLLFGLIYQNTPGRVSKSIIDQPVLYEVHLPGIAYMPYAYISSLSVKFVGSRRKMAIEVPIQSPGSSTASTSIETIVPDAYELDISVTGLNPETRNFLYANIAKPKLTVNAVLAPVQGVFDAFSGDATQAPVSNQKIIEELPQGRVKPIAGLLPPL
jgi:hypothetical protein